MNIKSASSSISVTIQHFGFFITKIVLVAYVFAILAWSWNTQAYSGSQMVDFNDETPLVQLAVDGVALSSPRMGTFVFAEIEGLRVQVELRNSDGGVFVPEDMGYHFGDLNQARVQVAGFAVVKAESAQFNVGPAHPNRQSFENVILAQHNRPPHVTQPVQPRRSEISFSAYPEFPFVLGYSTNGLPQAILLVESLAVETSL